VFDEALADVAAAAVDDVEHAGREAGLRKQLDVALAERGRVRGGLEDDRVAGDDRWQRLPGGDRDREVPGRDRADDADRHPHRHLELVAELRRSCLAKEAPALAAHVVGHVDRFLDVARRLGLDLAHFVGHQVGELVLLVGE
jgi:hypothetical protein